MISQVGSSSAPSRDAFGFAQQVNVLLHEILILGSFICGFVDHGFTEEVQLRAERSPASEKEDMLQAAAHLR